MADAFARVKLEELRYPAASHLAGASIMQPLLALTISLLLAACATHAATPRPPRPASPLQSIDELIRDAHEGVDYIDAEELKRRIAQNGRLEHERANAR